MIRNRNSLLYWSVILLVFTRIGIEWFQSWQREQALKAPLPAGTQIETVSNVPPPKTEEEWRKRLTPAQYHILREKGTEPPFSSPLDHETRPGTYVGADCGEPLFRSEQKYDSGTGWPSFWAPISPDAVKLVEDNSLPLEKRMEVVSAACGGHLGHVFDDGPPPTGKRYCINGLALRFVPDQTTESQGEFIAEKGATEAKN